MDIVYWIGVGVGMALFVAGNPLAGVITFIVAALLNEGIRNS